MDLQPDQEMLEQVLDINTDMADRLLRLIKAEDADDVPAARLKDALESLGAPQNPRSANDDARASISCAQPDDDEEEDVEVEDSNAPAQLLDAQDVDMEDATDGAVETEDLENLEELEKLENSVDGIVKEKGGEIGKMKTGVGVDGTVQDTVTAFRNRSWARLRFSVETPLDPQASTQFIHDSRFHIRSYVHEAERYRLLRGQVVRLNSAIRNMTGQFLAFEKGLLDNLAKYENPAHWNYVSPIFSNLKPPPSFNEVISSILPRGSDMHLARQSIEKIGQVVMYDLCRVVHQCTPVLEAADASTIELMERPNSDGVNEFIDKLNATPIVYTTVSDAAKYSHALGSQVDDTLELVTTTAGQTLQAVASTHSKIMNMAKDVPNADSFQQLSVKEMSAMSRCILQEAFPSEPSDNLNLVTRASYERKMHEFRSRLTLCISADLCAQLRDFETELADLQREARRLMDDEWMP